MARDKTLADRLLLREVAVAQWLPGLPLRVLDLGAGEGLLWKKLREQLPVQNYLPVDRAPKMPGVMQAKVDMALLSSIGLSQFNLIDCETDDALELWLAIAMLLSKPAVVCFTVPPKGRKPWLAEKQKAMLGIPVAWQNVPADDALHDCLVGRAVQRGAQYARVNQPLLRWENGRTTGYGVFCPGR